MKLFIGVLVISATAIFSAFVGLGVGYYWQQEAIKQSKKSMNEVLETLISVKEMGVLNITPYNEFWRNITYYEIISEVPPEEALDSLQDFLLTDIKKQYSEVELLCSKLGDPKYKTRCEETLVRANEIVLKNNSS